MFLPSVMGKPEKMPTRHGVIPRSTDLYDGSFNDQEVEYIYRGLIIVWSTKCTGESMDNTGNPTCRLRTETNERKPDNNRKSNTLSPSFPLNSIHGRRRPRIRHGRISSFSITCRSCLTRTRSQWGLLDSPR
jgi:hypothetical protein